MSDQTEFLVVCDDTGRHAIWPTTRELPWGWTPEGFTGSRDACLAHISTVWRDLDVTVQPEAGS